MPTPILEAKLLSDTELAHIRKKNSGKAWGHCDSAVEHVAKLLAHIDRLEELEEAFPDYERWRDTLNVTR